ncbi:MAG: hypothetical protein ACRDJN_01015, partial [Chloroflexota bacterium]
MIAGDERVTIMREYGSARECQREAARLRRQGWEIVSVLDRPSTPGRLTPLMALPPPLRREPDREFLVTYVWRATTGRPVPPPPTSPRFGDRLM